MITMIRKCKRCNKKFISKKWRRFCKKCRPVRESVVKRNTFLKNRNRYLKSLDTDQLLAEVGYFEEGIGGY